MGVWSVRGSVHCRTRDVAKFVVSCGSVATLRVGEQCRVGRGEDRTQVGQCRPIMGDNELSFSSSVIIVYTISGVIFVLLVLSLFVMGLAPIAPCCSCSKCIRNLINLPEEKLDWGVHQIQASSCPKCLKELPIFQPEKLSTNSKDLENTLAYK